MRRRGLQHHVAGHKLADRLAEPADDPVGGEHELLVGGLGKARWRAHRSRRPAPSGPRPRAPWRPSPPPRRPGANRKPSSRPIDVSLDHDLAGLGDFGLQHRVLSQPPHQHAGAAIDETFGQPLVQRVGQPVLDRARDALPMLGIGQPIRAVGRKGPGPDMRDAGRERVDVAVDVVRLRDLAGEPIGRNAYPPASESHRGGHQLRMGGGRNLPIVGNLAHIPQPLDRCRGRSRARARPRRARRARAPGCPRRAARG